MSDPVKKPSDAQKVKETEPGRYPGYENPRKWPHKIPHEGYKEGQDPTKVPKDYPNKKA